MLREAQYNAPLGAPWGFALMPEDAATGSSTGNTPERHWQQAEVKQAIEAAQEAGLESYRVEIAPDGMISIVVGPSADAAAAEASGPDLRGL